MTARFAQALIDGLTGEPRRRAEIAAIYVDAGATLDQYCREIGTGVAAQRSYSWVNGYSPLIALLAENGKRGAGPDRLPVLPARLARAAVVAKPAPAPRRLPERSCQRWKTDARPAYQCGAPCDGTYCEPCRRALLGPVRAAVAS